MILHLPTQGVVRVFMDPGSRDSSIGDMSAVTHQGVTTLTTSTGQVNIDGARWHLLSTIFGEPPGTKARIEREIRIQESLDASPKYRSFSWNVMRQAKKIYGATRCQGDTTLTHPPFFDQAHRGNKRIWGQDEDGPLVINWRGLNATQPLGPYRTKGQTYSPLRRSQNGCESQWKCQPQEVLVERGR